MKIGIKQFSNKFDNYKDYLIEYWEKQKYDYIELYVAPNQLDNLPLWYELKNKYGINYTIHAPHFSQGVNLADKNLFDHNKNVYQEVNTYAKELDVEYTVVHAGMDGSIEEVAKHELIKIPNVNIVRGNKPKTILCYFDKEEFKHKPKDSYSLGRIKNRIINNEFKVYANIVQLQREILKGN